MFQGKPTQDQQEQSSIHTPEKRTQDLQDQADQSPHTKVIFFLIPNCNSHFIMLTLNFISTFISFLNITITDNQLKETDSQLRNLVQVLSKLALHVPKGYPKGSWMNREDSLQRYLQIHDQKQGGKNDMLEHLDKGKLLKSKDLGPFAKLYAIQSFAAPEENPFTEEDEDITLRSMIGSPPLKGWLWNGGRTAGVRRKLFKFDTQQKSST